MCIFSLIYVENYAVILTDFISHIKKQHEKLHIKTKSKMIYIYVIGQSKIRLGHSEIRVWTSPILDCRESFY